jgi:hypothetical protein
MSVSPPIIDGRNRDQILRDLLARAPGYIPEWLLSDATPAYALLAILARDVEIQATAENGMPGCAQLAFLSTLGNSLLPAQSARTPLIFQLMPNAPMDVTLPENSQIAAKLPPPPPSLLSGSQTPPPAPIFSTEGNITLTRATLTALYSVDPTADTYADHSASQTTGFTLLDNMQPVPHQLYLGHDSLFAIASNAEIDLSFDLGPSHPDATPRPLLIDWEYLSQDGWLPLSIMSDGTARLTQDGKLALRLMCGPDANNDNVNGVSSFWIRGTVSARVPSGVIGPLPGGYVITWDQSPSVNAGAIVTIYGTPTKQDGSPNQAAIVKVLRSTITLSSSLSGAIAGATVIDAGTSSFVGTIRQISGGLTLVLDGVDPGRSITLDGTNTATVIAELNGTAILDQPLVGAAPNAVLNDADSKNTNPVGRVVDAGTDFFVSLDTAADFLKGDVVTVDGATHAEITQLEANGVTLKNPIGNADQGNQLTLLNALPVVRAEGAGIPGVLPTIDIIRARVGFTKTNLMADEAATDTAPVDLSNTFYPFGKQPEQFTTFYIASKEVFARQGAEVVINFMLKQLGVTYDDSGAAATMTWTIEYYGSGWTALGPNQKLLDQTKTFTTGVPVDGLVSGSISFVCPNDWAQTSVNGDSNYWLRIRIDSGNYGHPIQISVDPNATPPTVKVSESTLAPPVVASVSLQYTYYTNSELLDHCLTFNDFAFTDHSQDCRWPRRTFQPFTPVGDNQPGIHFGFSQQLPAGLVSLYFAAGESADGSSQGTPGASPFLWEYYTPRGWVELSVLDETVGFVSSGVIQFVGPPDATTLSGLGGSLYWLRARLKPDLAPEALPATGLWLNAVWAHQGETVQQDTLGMSNGNPGQTFLFAPQHVPVLAGELIEVQEWTGRGDDWTTAVAGVPVADLRFVYDPTDGKTVIAVWVTWHGQPYFYLSGPNDRHYVIERATGVLEFPTPPYGMIPPGGATVIASYTTGGALTGNVPAGTITELHTSASYVQSVGNPFAATGGSDTELTPRALDRALHRVRHRNRAMAAADYEWLTREASPEVARARCLSITGPDGTGERGWVKLIVIPNSTDAAPEPTAGLLQEIAAELQARMPAAIVGQLILAPPSYTPVGVRADIVPDDINDAALVEARLRERLAAFLHPLTGGVAGTGWDFGESVYLSQVATVVAGTDGVDCVPLLQLIVDDAVAGDAVTIDPDTLVAEGDHQLKLLAGGS